MCIDICTYTHTHIRVRRLYTGGHEAIKVMIGFPCVFPECQRVILEASECLQKGKGGRVPKVGRRGDDRDDREEGVGKLATGGRGGAGVGGSEGLVE